MRWLAALVLALALGVMGCGETTGTGGTAGDGGVGGSGGVGGIGGSAGGAGGMPECESAGDCDDGNECTEDACADGVCDNTAVEDGTECGEGAGTCQQGSCQMACSEQGIRDAIAAGGGPYTFPCDGPQTVVTEAEIVIDNDVILNGEGNLTVDGNDDHRVFSVLEGVTAKLNGFVVTRGLFPPPGVPPSGTVGGGILNSGTLTVTNSTVSANRLDGIWNTGQLTVTNSTVSDNGSGILNLPGGSLRLTNSTVSGSVPGDGIKNDGAPLVVITNSTVSGNAGYGVTNHYSTATVTNSTFFGNGTNVANREPDGTLTIASSILSGDDSCRWDITSLGYNIESPGNTCGFNQTGDRSGVIEAELNLGPLTDNGGPTKTHKPGGGGSGEGSAAIDRIPESDCAVDADQRGEPRPEAGGTMCDVGSVEVQPDDVVQCADNVCRCTEAGVRAAIALGGAEPYTFDCGDGMTVVTEAEIVIDNDVTLDGGGVLTVDGNDAHRVFSVATGITALLRGITVTGGVGQPFWSSAERGGGILNEGRLTLEDCTVQGNTAATGGGGITNGTDHGSVILTLRNTRVSGNTAGLSGGGIGGWGVITLTDSTVSGNTGGGIACACKLTLTNSTVSDNTQLRDNGSGGGIWHNTNVVPLTLTNSTVSGNTAPYSAGGIYSFGDITLTNSTVSYNTTSGDGGGINVRNATLTNSTVSNNTASVGGGIYIWYGTLTLMSSTISGNVATHASGGSAILASVESSMATLIDGDCRGTLTSNGYNIESPGNTCGFNQTGDQSGVTAEELNLGPLVDNGGPTMTHALRLLPTPSVAIDHIPEADCTVDTDQRGEPRPAGAESKCDVGAFEVQP